MFRLSCRFIVPIILCSVLNGCATATRAPEPASQAWQFLVGPFKGGWYAVKQNISNDDFSLILKSSYKQLQITSVFSLKDESFTGAEGLTEVHLNHMSNLSDKALSYLKGVTFLKLEDCPGITYEGVAKMKSLKSLYLWNMPHFTAQHLALLRERHVKIVTDGRFKKYSISTPAS